MIMKETERAKEKKEKQKKRKQNNNITRRNEIKSLKWTAPKSPRECLGDVPCCLFFVDFDPKSSGTERRRYRNEDLGGFLGPSASR